jgi:hypothetical protein
MIILVHSPSYVAVFIINRITALGGGEKERKEVNKYINGGGNEETEASAAQK